MSGGVIKGGARVSMNCCVTVLEKVDIHTEDDVNKRSRASPRNIKCGSSCAYVRNYIYILCIYIMYIYIYFMYIREKSRSLY